MSGLNSPFYRALTVANGSVRTTGVSKGLGKGELALVDVKDVTKVGDNIGARVLSSLAGKRKDEKRFQIRVGTAHRDFTRSHSSSAIGTPTFSLDEVKSVRVSVPERTEQSFDEIILGYNGIDPETSFKFNRGTGHFNLWLELCGGGIPYNGSGLSKEIFEVSVHIPECDITDTCTECDACEDVDPKAITEELIRRLKEKQLTGGTSIEQYVDITPIYKCDNDGDRELIPYNFFEITVCDRGTENDLSKVQAQYPSYKVVAKDRKGPNSVYEILVPDADGAPSDYSVGLDSILKDCEDCPAGYSASEAGYIYAITIEDDGADLTTDIDDVPGFVTGSVIKSGNDNGVGFYTVLVEDKLTDAEITTFLEASAVKSTATFKELGEARQICSSNTVSTTPWVETGTCNISTDQYTITLKDDKCGNSRLDELQRFYPEYLIEEGIGESSVELTLAGTDGTANIEVGGTEYLATFDTDLTDTAAAFVTDHAVDLEAAGVVVTANAGVLTFVGATQVIEDIIIINVSDSLDGTLGIVTAESVTGACQRKYVATVFTDMVCEECDPVFLKQYQSELPEKYDGNNKWSKVENVAASPNGNCLAGIRIVGKPFILDGEEALRDDIGFVETSVALRAAAGYPSEQRLGVGRIPNTADMFSATYLSRKSDRDNLVGNLRNLEQESLVYFVGEQYPKTYLERMLKGNITNLPDSRNQARIYYVELEHRMSTQSFANISTDNIVYPLIVEEGKHQEVEAIVNAIAVGAGLDVTRVSE